MSKKLADFKNPLTSTSGSVLDVSQWLGGILWVVMFGMIVAIGSRLLNTIDKKIPGDLTPDVKPYKQTVVPSNNLTVI